MPPAAPPPLTVLLSTLKERRQSGRPQHRPYRLSYRPPPRPRVVQRGASAPTVLRTLLGAAYRGLPSATPAQAVELAWALGRLRVVPPADWMRRWGDYRQMDLQL